MEASLVQVPTKTRELSILLVEDNPGDVQLFRMALERGAQAAHLQGVTSGEAALERLASIGAGDLPDAVVLDLKLPGLGGLEVLERIRRDRRFGAVPVFILSGSTTDREVVRAYRLGANGFFSKSSGDLSRTVAAMTAFASQVVRPATSDLRSGGADSPNAGEEFFRLAVESAPNGMVMVDEIGNVALVNSQVEKLFGYSRDELIGESIHVLVPERYRARHPAHWENFMARPQTRAMGAGRDLYGRRKDGSEFPVEIGLNPIETAGGVYVLASVVDITARKAAEETLERQKRELERSNAELEQFAYVASHDLREPLRMVSSFADVLRQDHHGQLDEEARECLGFILSGVSRMDKLVRDLLTYAKVGTGAEHRPTEIDRVIDTALANLHVAVRRLEPRIERQPMPAVLGEETELVQLFQNLLDNALKFHRELPPVIRIKAQRQDDMWLVSVRDEGVGIPGEHHRRIFQVFQRLHSGTHEPAGTGIGLAIAKRIVESGGGRIWVESRPGEGSCFYFTLPAASGRF